MPKQFAFPASNRLRSKKRIDELFKQGKAVTVKPLRIAWLAENASETHLAGCQVLVSVSKRNFKRSNKRNTIKRRVKEAWRLNTVAFNQFICDRNKSLILGIIYTDKEICDFATIEQNVIIATEKIKKKLNAEVENSELKN